MYEGHQNITSESKLHWFRNVIVSGVQKEIITQWSKMYHCFLQIESKWCSSSILPFPSFLTFSTFNLALFLFSHRSKSEILSLLEKKKSFKVMNINLPFSEKKIPVLTPFYLKIESCSFMLLILAS